MHSLEAQAEAIMIYQAISKETVPQIGFWQKKKSISFLSKQAQKVKWT